jgi:DNA-binding transcriptional MocR family regulator
MPSPLSMALMTQWIEDGTADNIRRFIRAESAARQTIASEVLGGFDYKTAENAFNLWLCLPDGMARADIVARMARRRLGLVPSDAFTVEGTPSECLRVCLGGSIDRDDLRSNLQFLANTMQPNEFLG